MVHISAVAVNDDDDGDDHDNDDNEFGVVFFCCQ